MLTKLKKALGSPLVAYVFFIHAVLLLLLVLIKEYELFKIIHTLPTVEINGVLWVGGAELKRITTYRMAAGILAAITLGWFISLLVIKSCRAMIPWWPTDAPPANEAVEE